MDKDSQYPETKTAYVYFTRIVNGDRCFGFGVTEAGEQVYITGSVVDSFDLTQEDLGTKNLMALIPDKGGKADYAAISLLIEDSALQQAYEWAKDEIERLQGLLEKNGVEF